MRIRKCTEHCEADQKNRYYKFDQFLTKTKRISRIVQSPTFLWKHPQIFTRRNRCEFKIIRLRRLKLLSREICGIIRRATTLLYQSWRAPLDTKFCGKSNGAFERSMDTDHLVN